MHEYRNETGPHLIVVPKSTLSNWMNEIARWAPDLKAVKFHGDKATREAIVQQQLEPAQKDEDREWNVLVTTYEVCNIEKNVLKKFAWSYLIIDEVGANESKTAAVFGWRTWVLPCLRLPTGASSQKRSISLLSNDSEL